MSNAARIPYARMLSIAQSIVSRLAANCKRIEIAGSIRRQKDMIGDIEIVAVPTEALYAQLDELLAADKIRHAVTKRWGQKLRSFAFDTKSGDAVQVDLFLQPDPETWGVNYMIRTGSPDFSKRMVTKRSMGGWMPDYYQVDEARVWRNDKALETPEEQDVFALWRMDYVAPEQRTVEYRPVLREVSLDFTLDELPEFAQAPVSKFSPERAAALINEPVPTFGGREGAGRAAQAAIEASEAERRRVQGGVKL